MLHEEEPESMSRDPPQWPPPGAEITKAQGFMGKISMGKGPGGRPVEWPPRPSLPGEQGENAQNMTTTYPSGFKFKEGNNPQGMIVTSQPAFKISQPVRRRGDDKWPPRGTSEEPLMEVREFVKPKKATKDYSKFFAQNALPHNYSGYRPPPGTQHWNSDEQEVQQGEEEEEEEEEEEDEEEEEEEE
ncbi:high mobility group protein B2-like isoform X2 [Eriocheir sinensis]|nr:high mobility group protein B2-like isoform X2 [Eriocheir sinensis]